MHFRVVLDIQLSFSLRSLVSPLPLLFLVFDITSERNVSFSCSLVVRTPVMIVRQQYRITSFLNDPHEIVGQPPTSPFGSLSGELKWYLWRLSIWLIYKKTIVDLTIEQRISFRMMKFSAFKLTFVPKRNFAVHVRESLHIKCQVFKNSYLITRSATEPAPKFEFLHTPSLSHSSASFCL